jgi:hypothetical protein
MLILLMHYFHLLLLLELSVVIVTIAVNGKRIRVGQVARVHPLGKLIVHVINLAANFLNQALSSRDFVG